MRRVVLIAAAVLTALTMGLEFAHVLEWPQKQDYPGRLYVRLQESLYIWFGNLGGVLYVLSIVATVALAILFRRRPGWRGWTAAAGLQVIGLATFLTVIYPVNLRLPVSTAGAVPPDWVALRDRWELGHTVGFALFGVSFLLLVVTMVRQMNLSEGTR